MTIKQKLLSCAAGAAVLTTAGAASAQSMEEELDIIVVTHGQAVDPFWNVVQNGVDDAAEHANVDTSYQAPDRFDMVRMRELLDAAVAEQPDGLVVSVPDPDALRGGIEDAIASGIPVITINTGAELSQEVGAITHIGQTEYEAGVGAGEYLAEQGDIEHGVCVNHEVGNVALDQRCNGFEEGLGEDVEVDVLGVETDPTEIERAFQAYMSENPNTNAVLTVGPLSGKPVLSALRGMGAAEAMNFGTFDLDSELLQAVDNGVMDFAVDQQQYLQGYLSVVLLAQHARWGVQPVNDIIRTGPGLVTQDDAAAVIDWAEQGYR